ncbi:MAG: TIGR02452 family protein [Lachnospiraceae bacterium]|nr:TIGR02452 family protein [Lachnospiraceae bacterium]
MPDMENMSPEELKKLMAQMQQKEYEGLTPEEIEEKKKEKEMRKRKNIALLDETIELCQKGCYERDGKTVEIGLSEEEMREICVFLPDEIAALPAKAESEGQQKAAFRCENKDALSLAQEDREDPSYQSGNSGANVLVLNLASATRPGGASRDGANGQEEDLCRKSTLLLSLETEEARRYYDYNNDLHTRLGSDGVLISPHVAVIRDAKGELLAQPFEISVMSCSAPMVRLGLEGKSEEEYKEMLLGRIRGMLRCAGSLGYKNLVLGAFGCGVFGNDAAVVSDAFKKALDGTDGCGFEHVDFAVLCTEGKEYNYQEFCRNFG